MCDISQCYNVLDKDAIDEHVQLEKAGLSWHVYRRCLFARQESLNLVHLVCGMKPRQWRLPMLQARVDRAYMVQWVPTPNCPLPLHSAVVVILLETLGNDAPLTPFQLETFFAASHLVLIVRANTLVVLEGCLDMCVQDILRESGRPQDLY